MDNLSVISLGTIGYCTHSNFGAKATIERKVVLLFLLYNMPKKIPKGMYSHFDIIDRYTKVRNRIYLEFIIAYRKDIVEQKFDERYYYFYDFVSVIQNKLQGNAFKLRKLCDMIYNKKLNWLDYKQEVASKRKFFFPHKIHLDYN